MPDSSAGSSANGTPEWIWSPSVRRWKDVHSPDEKIHIDTVEKYWNFLLAILKNVK